MRICFVCSGNICRSPSAENVMRALVARAELADEIEVCSAGIGDWHVGEQADPRSSEALTARGYDASSHRARQFGREWFDDHDLVIAMDRTHLRDLRRMAGASGEPLAARALESRAEDWRPWRGYAVMHLWRASGPTRVPSDAP